VPEAAHPLARLACAWRWGPLQRRKRLRLLQPALVVLLCMALLWTVLLWRMRTEVEHQRADARSELSSLTAATALSLAASLRVLDLALMDLRHAWQTSPDSLRARIELWRAFPSLDADFQISVVGHDGRIRFSTFGPGMVGVDVSDRETFRIHSAKAEDTLLLAQPRPSKISPSLWLLPISRPMLRSDGSFGGMMVLLVHPEYLTRIYKLFPVGDAGVIALMRSDRRVVLRSEFSPASDGRILTQLPVSEVDTEKASRFELTLPAGLTSAVSPVDDKERVYAWRQLDEFHVALLVGKRPELLYHDADNLRQSYLTAGVIFSVLLVLVVALQNVLQRSRAYDARLQKLRIRQLSRANALLEASRRALRQMHGQELAAREDERGRIARDLHDELGQRMTALILQTSIAARSARESGPQDLKDSIQFVKSGLVDALGIVRDVSARLRPALLDMSLSSAIESLIRTTAVAGRLQCYLDDRLPTDLRIDDHIAAAAYRVAQEALTNVIRHASARRIDVRLELEGTELLLTVRDDGSGFREPPARAFFNSRGLVGMEERLLAVGGSVELRSAPGSGTEVSARLPMQGPARNPRSESVSA